jgi:integrase
MKIRLIQRKVVRQWPFLLVCIRKISGVSVGVSGESGKGDTPTMALTDVSIRALKPREKPYKAADGKGLYLYVTPAGGKLWRFKFRAHGKEKLLSLGAYPDLGLAAAREARDKARSLIVTGRDPAVEKRRAKARGIEEGVHTFDSVAGEFIEKRQREGMAASTVSKAEWFRTLLKPAIGREPVGQVDPQMLLAALKRFEGRGNYETASRARSFASRVFRYAVATGRATADPAALLSGALTARKATNFAAILDPIKFGGFLRAIEDFSGSPAIKLALQIAPHVFVRPGELRHAVWAEINFDEKIWRIPANRMKARRPHGVPLSRQVLAYLRELNQITGPAGYLFPSIRTRARPMSENTLNACFRRLGYGPDEVTAHGLRATASTLLNESNLWNPDAIERALAHGDSDAVRGFYHRGEHWPERVKMAQWWSDYLDTLRSGAQILQLKQRREG